MKPFILLICLTSFLWAASDTLYDTSVTTVSWAKQPMYFSLDWKTGNAIPVWSSQVNSVLMSNGPGTMPIWTDSLQHIDSAYGQPMDTLINAVFTHCKKWAKKLAKTKQAQ